MPDIFNLQGYGHLLLEGAWLSLRVALAAMLVVLALGMAGALARLSRSAPLRVASAAYTTIVRGIPELVLLLIVYYGGTVLLQVLMELVAGGEQRVDINAFLAGTLVLGIVYGAYAAEVFRGAFLSVPRGQTEAAESLGMRPGLVFWRIRLPLAMRFAVPGLGNLWLTLLKATSITSVIGLTELARQADLIKAPTHRPFATFFLASLLYLAATALSDLLRLRIQRWADAGVRRD